MTFTVEWHLVLLTSMLAVPASLGQLAVAAQEQTGPGTGAFAENLALLNNQLTMGLTQQRVHTFMPESQLAANTTVLAYSRVYRVIGKGLLPLSKHLLQMRAVWLNMVCSRLGCSCRSFHIHLHAPTLGIAYEDLINLKDDNSEVLCQTHCVIRSYPDPESLSDCAACESVKPEVGFEQYGQTLTVLEASVTRESSVPMVARTLWNSTTLQAYLAAAGSEAELPQLESHIIHHVPLAQHAVRWHQVTAVSLTMQLSGPHVVPMTVGKTSLILYVLSKMEGDSPDLNQYFRLHSATHDAAHGHAHVTVIIVHSREPSVSHLDKVLVANPAELQQRIVRAGLPLTALQITSIQPYRHETVPDQIAAKLSFWQRHAGTVWPALYTGLAAMLVAAGVWYKGFWAATDVGSSGFGNSSNSSSNASLPVEGWSSNAAFMEAMASKYAKQLHLSMCIGPQIESTSLEVSRRADGSPWVLGQGACGIVYKAVRDGVQDVALKVLAVASAEGLALQSFTKEISLLRALSFHGNMVQLYGVCVDAQHPILVFEYMAGGDLYSCLHSKPSTEFSWYNRGCSVALDIARGLVYLHEQNVVHNDIKSKNILLSQGGEVAKIADVGTAAVLGATATASSTGFVGTFVYAAPEQLLGNRASHTTKLDMYSFGVLLWEIVTHEVPRRGDLRDAQIPGECPQDIENLIDACLSPTPTARPSAREAFSIIQISSSRRDREKST